MALEEGVDLISVHIGWPVTKRPDVGRSIHEVEINPTVHRLPIFTA